MAPQEMKAPAPPQWRLFLHLLQETWTAWNEHKAPKMGAALAYYTTFAMAPLVVLTVGVVGLVMDQSAARKALVGQLSELIGKEGGALTEAIITQSAHPEAGAWAAIIGFAVLLVGASGVFVELQDSLNTIWGVPPRATWWRGLIRERLLSFAMVFALGFLVLVSLLLSAGIAALGLNMSRWVPGFDMVWESANSLISFIITTLLFAAIYRFLPDTRIAWRDVWTGAALTAALFILGKYLLGIYLGHSAFASAYGAAGSLIIILVWVFYSAQIFFMGAEFTCVFAKRHGSHSGKPVAEV